VETWAVTNEEQARYWNGDEAVHWLVHEERYERMLAPFTDHLLTSAAIGDAPTGSSTSVAAPGPRPERLGGSQSKQRPWGWTWARRCCARRPAAPRRRD